MDNVPIPLSRRRNCSFCQCMIDSNGVGTYQLVTGWSPNRKQGGTNAVSLPHRHDEYACPECIDKLRHGIPVGQLTLFGGEWGVI